MTGKLRRIIDHHSSSHSTAAPRAEDAERQTTSSGRTACAAPSFVADRQHRWASSVTCPYGLRRGVNGRQQRRLSPSMLKNTFSDRQLFASSSQPLHTSCGIVVGKAPQLRGLDPASAEAAQTSATIRSSSPPGGISA